MEKTFDYAALKEKMDKEREYQLSNYEEILNNEIQKLKSGQYNHESDAKDIYYVYYYFVEESDCTNWSKSKKKLFIQYSNLFKKLVKKSFSKFDKYKFDEDWDWDANCETRRIQFAIENETVILEDINKVLLKLK